MRRQPDDENHDEDEDEDDESFLRLLLILVSSMEPGGFLHRMMCDLETAEVRSLWAPRRLKQESSRKFSEVIDKHFATDPQCFRRYFRMTRNAFFKLCSTICSHVGEKEFRPEQQERAVYRGAVKDAGGVVCGEVRVAICIRLLAGASYLDLMVIFDLSHRSIFRSFHTVIRWINKSFTFPLVRALADEDVL